MSLNQLAELHQAELDEATVDQLFTDIAALTQVIEVLPKYQSQVYAPDTPITLEDARELLRIGAVRGVQVRYRHDGAQWWDTLMRTPTGVRVVRIRHDF